MAVVAAALVWSAAPEAASRPPKFVYQRMQLPNGLTVVLNQDRSTPIVNVQLWYHVGSKDEKPGRTGFAPRPDGTHEKIPQTGPVVIEDDVEIGANTTIDRPAVGETRIKSGTKIDNLVQIAHGVVLGRNVLLAAQVGIAGSTVIGDSAQFGGQVGVGGHLTIGDRVKAVGQTGITNSVDADAFISGYPAIANSEWRRSSAVFRKLPEMRKQLRALEERLKKLEGK